MLEIEFDKLLKEYSIPFKKQNYEINIDIYKIETKKNINIVVISNNSNTFKIDRDLFYYLDNQKLLYGFILINKSDNGLFYLEFNNKKNWLNSSFERTDKEELFFGKIVLNNKISENDLVELIKKY